MALQKGFQREYYDGLSMYTGRLHEARHRLRLRDPIIREIRQLGGVGYLQPALHVSEPLSMTTAGISSSMVVKLGTII
jgi:hypothetical protein